MPKLPELLSPAGSPEALYAAIEGGADAVYFGGELYSNRMRAKNFTSDELRDAIELCDLYGVASYVTMNTRLRDRELREAFGAARELYEAGADAFIVADVGLARIMRELLPSVELHGSTQMTGVSAIDAEALRSLGFSRMVCPRELSMEELRSLVKSSPIEIEAFVHGAHCVSVSGQCLMSWAMGGRSGNRGECAQPCRLPYQLSAGGKRDAHPLSLKDMCLASYIPELIDMGVSSLKIEGRLKNPDYVYGVTRIYRRLLDERRGATPDEIRELDSIFSRDGFTDGYFKRNFKSMTGMRSEDAVSSGARFVALEKRVPVSAHIELASGKEAVLTLSDGRRTVTAYGDVVESARSAPMTCDAIYKNVSKLGSTRYSLDGADFTADVSGDVFIAASKLNSLRRDAVERLERSRLDALVRRDAKDYKHLNCSVCGAKKVRTAEFVSSASVPRSALSYFDVIFTPEGTLVESLSGGCCEVGLSMPPWEADGERCRRLLKDFASNGGRRVLCHTLGQITCAVEEGLVPTASMRLNLTNSTACTVLSSLGAEYLHLSPELKDAAVADIAGKCSSVGAIVYGKLPLMLLRRCIMSDSRCSGNCGGDGCLLPTRLSDRKGASIGVLPLGDRVNLLINPVPVYMADKMDRMGFVAAEHYVFTDESPAEAEGIIASYTDALTPEEAGLQRVKRL